MDELLGAILTQQAEDRNFTVNALMASHEARIGALSKALFRLTEEVERLASGDYAPSTVILLYEVRMAQAALGDWLPENDY